MKRNFLMIAGALLLTGACHQQRITSTSVAPQGAVRVADCVGPATSLPDSLAARLPPRTGRMHPDDQWADIARTTPGGFAGSIRDSTHRLILMLTKPELTGEAKAALADRLPFPFESATVRQVRWDFAQLVDWFNYLLPRIRPDGVWPTRTKPRIAFASRRRPSKRAIGWSRRSEHWIFRAIW